ncbi:cytochrome bo3 quinol oxidase subunit 1 apoprotein [Devosia sp. YR412]|uniref:cbb3-type cytochrome c oxidase subunit I n=1 Tax=Devosia sp. YR412 TaxID=1881030 RepID=UPI0008C29443|nr:cbb3-type cytochrome c oxidase subunit I [Devosia sp. YR412]SEQ41666.1 cytochrome bo3 quinol oxidase subunit 1 apoprotein [Devosia sp. YR412]
MNPDLLFGKLTLDALPFYSPIAAGGAATIVLGGVAVVGLITWLKAWTYLWTEWFTSTDHKKLGIMYVILALVMLLRGFVDALMMRAQQAIAMGNEGYLTPDHFQQVFSSHGTIMIFFMGMPFLFGIMNYVVPLQLGARDVAFPLLNAIGLWLTAAGAALVMASLVIGVFSTGGWTGYPPYTELSYSPTVGVDYWIMALLIAGTGTTLSAINFIVTIYKMRAPGMGLMQMPLFCWTALCASLLAVFALPGLTVAGGLLALDRYLGMHFFTNDGGGNVMNYANLFWIFGHPEVYILILPAFGVFSTVIPTFSQKRLFGYNVLVYATMCIAVLSFTVWLHHFFTMGADANVNAFFGIMTAVIAVPTGVKVYDWILTMYRGRLRFDTPMLWSIAFILTFVIGGMTGVILSIPPLDYVFHNTLFLIAHFHNMLIPGMLFGLFAGYAYWFPKAFGFPLDETWGRRAFWFWVVGFYLAFMPLYVLGFMGAVRRMTYYDQPEWQVYFIIAAIGALSVLLGIVSQIIQLVVSIRNRAQTANLAGDHWGGQTLEWSTSSPPPEYNFAVLPTVCTLDAFQVAKDMGTPHLWPERYEPLEVPRNTMVGLVFGALAFLLGFATVWHIWWLAGLAIIGIVGITIARSFATETTRIIPASEIALTELRWKQAILAQQGDAQ